MIKALIYSSWSDFQTQLQPLGKKVKGDAFEQLVHHYFKLSNKFSMLYDEVWLLSDVPQKVLDDIGLLKQDLGIDLLARVGDEYHAIQCKYHSDKSKAVTYKEVSTFLTLLQSNDKITMGYICSSASDVSVNLRKVGKQTKQIQHLMFDTWSSLEDSFFDKIKAHRKGQKVKESPFKPRPHQDKAIKASAKHFKDASRGKLIFPCGAGKSLTGYWMTNKLKSKTTLIAVPSLSLVKQTIEVYLRETVANGRKVKWLCICSDEGIGRSEDVAIYTENVGVPCQTNPAYIEQWLKDNRDHDKFVFTTYHSGRIIAEVSKRLGITFDVGIFDEAHKTVGSNKKLFSHLLFEENISIAKRIFMTATERFYAGSKDDILSMDDEEIYGDTFTKMTFKEAIEQNLLTDYKVVTIDVKESEVAEFIRDNDLVTLNSRWGKETEARSLASMLALRKAMDKYPIKNAVSFHSSIEKARRNKDLQSYITASYGYPELDVYTVSGKDKTTERNEIVQEFASSDHALITNAKCLTEGVDVPNIDCIVFADPRRSKVDIVQALGRALRKKEGKDWGYVILPIIYDDATDQINDDNFNEIVSVVRGLASNDERIIEYFKDKESAKEKGEKRAPRANQFQFEVISDYVDEETLSENLEVRLWDRIGRYEYATFDKALKFARGLQLQSYREWKNLYKYNKLPSDIPYGADRVYRNKGWKGWGYFLGTGNVKAGEENFLPFKQARLKVRALSLKDSKAWTNFKKSKDFPSEIPRAPWVVYENDGWSGMKDWLGTGQRVDFLSFEDAREFARKTGITTSKEWGLYAASGKRPAEIPSNPQGTYKDEGWKGWVDWLGTEDLERSLRKVLPFQEAQEYILKLNLKSRTEWYRWAKSGQKPVFIPLHPDATYKHDGWVDFYHWLDIERPRVKLNFIEAREFVRKLKLGTVKNWQAYSKTKRPDFIPSAPSDTYKKDWKGWGDFLGERYLTYEELQKQVQELGIQWDYEYAKHYEKYGKDAYWPRNPSTIFRDKGWKGWVSFLGMEYLSFVDAKKYVRSLNIKSSSQWKKLCKANSVPRYMPRKPDYVYRDKGWKGWDDFLGKN